MEMIIRMKFRFLDMAEELNFALNVGSVCIPPCMWGKKIFNFMPIRQIRSVRWYE